jgi:eukaryotic-like serine/threonine-protein kinase
LERKYTLRPSGQHRHARASYQDFLDQWKNADPTVPILKEAKAEYEKLK